jgi:hypothetical protein
MVRSAVDERVMMKSVCNIHFFYVGQAFANSATFTRNDLDTLLHSDRSLLV